jgi:hypothetical protein
MVRRVGHCRTDDFQPPTLAPAPQAGLKQRLGVVDTKT